MTRRSWGIARLEAMRAVVLVGVVLGCAAADSDLEGTRLVERGATWRLSVDSAHGEPDPERPPLFADPATDDADWREVRTPVGFGADDLATEIEPLVPRGEDGKGKGDQVAVFLRHRFDVADAAAFDGLVLTLRADDGVRIFLNGREVLRSNMPGGWRVDADTRAVTAIGGAEETRLVRHGLPADLLQTGSNLLAVALHNTRPGSKDLAFDLGLVAQGGADTPVVLRGPYLQQVRGDAARVRLRTSRPVVAQVRFGLGPEALGREARSKKPTRDHEVHLRELPSGTSHAFAVDLLDGPHTTPDVASGRFQTAPRPGSRAPLRVWVTGDQGSGNRHARAVRDAFESFSRDRPAQLWLTLGDNAYPSGTPADWKANFFDVYASLLPRVAFFPTVGNHDLNAAEPLTGKTHYLEALSLPKRGGAGGTASGNELYYSFRWGNVHFVSIDSDRSDRSEGGPMARWLGLDLLHGTDSDWKVATVHHPPFSRGTHHDDRETKPRDVRRVIVPLLEDAGVDLVISGHSHAYERSHLLRGPHPEGFADDPGRVTAKATQRDGVATYPGDAGTVYVVAGSSGQKGPGTFDHPSMAVGLEAHGSLVLDIEGCTLEASFIDDTGAVLDAFRIEKDLRGGRCRGTRPGGDEAARSSPH